MLLQSFTPAPTRQSVPPSVASALEEELVGLSLREEEQSGPISPRTIKRPTNPVATCLDARKSGKAAGFAQSDKEVVKRPRLGSGSGPSNNRPGGSLMPSPPTLSPAIPPSFEFGGSNAPSNAASTQNSPIHRGAFSTRPVHEDLPKPVVLGPSAAEAVMMAERRPSFEAFGPDPPVYRSMSDPSHGGYAPRSGCRPPFGGRIPPAMIREASDSATDVCDAMRDEDDDEPATPPPRMKTPALPIPVPNAQLSANQGAAAACSPLECGSPVALATNALTQSLRVGPPNHNHTHADPPSPLSAGGLLPPSLIGSRPSQQHQQPHQGGNTAPFTPPPRPNGFFPPFSSPHSNPHHHDNHNNNSMGGGRPPFNSPMMPPPKPPSPWQSFTPPAIFGGGGAPSGGAQGFSTPSLPPAMSNDSNPSTPHSAHPIPFGQPQSNANNNNQSPQQLQASTLFGTPRAPPPPFGGLYIPPFGGGRP